MSQSHVSKKIQLSQRSFTISEFTILLTRPLSLLPNSASISSFPAPIHPSRVQGHFSSPVRSRFDSAASFQTRPIPASQLTHIRPCPCLFYRSRPSFLLLHLRIRPLLLLRLAGLSPSDRQRPPDDRDCKIDVKLYLKLENWLNHLLMVACAIVSKNTKIKNLIMNQWTVKSAGAIAFPRQMPVVLAYYIPFITIKSK